MAKTSETTFSPAGDGAREHTASDLAHALDEAYWARFRYQNRSSPIGFHGENFDRRAAKAEHIMQQFNERAVKRAREKALKAGWTPEELASLGLTGDLHDSGSARA